MTTIEIKYNGYNGSFSNAMISSTEAQHHQDNVNKLISQSKNIDEVMKILKKYFEEKQPKYYTDITVNINNNIFNIKKDLTSYEKLN